MSSTGRRSVTLANSSLSLVPAARDSFSIADQVVVVRLGGNLTASSRMAVRTHLLRLIQVDGPQEIVLDLSRVSSVNDAGVRPLLEAHRLQSDRGGGLHFGAISRIVAIYLYADPGVADVLMPQFGIEHPQHWAAEARWFEVGVVPEEDGAS